MSYIMKVTLGLNAVSALCAFSIIVLFLAIKCHDRYALNRVSMRLQAGITVVDIVKHVAAGISLNGEDAPWCSFVGFVVMATYHMYLCLSTCIALNLHLAIILNIKPSRRWEKYYWAGSILIPLLLNLPLLALGIFGPSTANMCYIKNGPAINNTLEIVYSCVLCSAVIIYCIAISYTVVARMRKEEPILPKTSLPNDPWEKTHSVFDLRSVICRTCLYPAAAFISCIGANVGFIYFYFFGKMPVFLLAWAVWGLSLMGCLNLAAFLADPMVQRHLPSLIHCDDASRDDSDMLHFQLPVECEFTYATVTRIDNVHSPLPCLRSRMVKMYQPYI
ncbi:hypothetical protein DSO57_1000101 [Entomophthora muscae]|uniref:Uncharacterized protein n=1 Tax=Entomophthora muscae TaxID=34485 RepID=A0ACC2SMN3_9FUNG|nr:hypothetical protein DSO57_1000101 [Entomophthora muscae]